MPPFEQISPSEMCNQSWPSHLLFSMIPMCGSVFAICKIPANSVQTASLPLCFGGLGLRSAERTLPAAHWASWADSLAMINARHPAVVRALETNVEVPFVREVQRCVDTLVEADFAVPSWEELADGVRPPPSHDEEEPIQSKHGWQKVAIPLTTGSYWSSPPHSQRVSKRSQVGVLAG